MSKPRSRTRSENTADPLPSSRPILSATTAFSVLLVVRLLSAAYATIPDCDEVFNFWEPAHYLSHGHGLQTWEYSPEYAIRSWAYIGLHSLATRAISLLPSTPTKTHEFYGLRVLLALSCAYAETRLYSAVSTAINRRVGLLYLIFTVCAAGMFHSAAAFLPSTFAMYTTMLGTAAFLRRQTVRGVFWFALGGLLGWPFSLAMCVPFVVEEVVVGVLGGRLAGTVGRFIKGGIVSLVLLGAIVAADYVAYRKLEVIPLNIVLYNVFGGEGKGPDIYGTEPWWFYMANLALNFNVLLPLALVSAPLLALHCVLSSTTATGSTRTLAAAAPFYLWLAIFTAQPHKEERFMFVLYPALCLNAALSHHTALALCRALSSRLPARSVLNWAVLVVPPILAAALSLSRVLAVTTAYSAPLHIYAALPPTASGNLCLAKEWYRFPSHYLLPEDVRAKFVSSAFDGLLPGEFYESAGRDGTWMLPRGMNDRNQPDPGKYITLPLCDYVVESYFAGHGDYEAGAEPDLVLDEAWEELYCEAFLDAARTPMLGRTLWVPGAPDVRRWGRLGTWYNNAGHPTAKTRPQPTMLESVNPRPALYLLAFAAVVLARLFSVSFFRRYSSTAEEKGEKEKEPTRKPGVWLPVTYESPVPPPYPDWDVHTTKPLPYRPFKYGPKYFITMGLRKMDPDEWIELDNDFLSYHASKAARIIARGALCSRTEPCAFNAACELLEHLVAYLPARYPSLFIATAEGMENTVTGESFDVHERPLKEDPMQMAARMVQDDIAIMVEGDDGRYYLRAGSILLPGFWRLQDKMGMSLDEIHESGEVPEYRERLKKGMNNFFSRVQPGGAALRHNYFLQVDDSLPWSHSIGDEDSDGIGWFTAEKNKAIQHHYFRSERQSLRRLPRTGGVVFTIRTYFVPVTEIAKEPYVPGRLASAVRSWGEDVSRYKGRERYQDILLEYLDGEHQKQVEAGLVVEEEEGKYPY